MTADEFPIDPNDWFSLVENADSYPTTGIKININGFDVTEPQNYQAQSTFRFTNKVVSQDADLDDLVISTGEVNTVNPANSTYKEYELTPNFSKGILDYELTLLEYIDTMDIKATLSDDTASMTIKVPKRDDDDNLVYESSGNIQYVEESTIQNNTPFEITLNKLGEPDTKITIKVTATDGSTKEYTVLIKRPYGTITGKVQLGETLRATGQSYGVFLEYIADIKIYEAGKFMWSDLLTATTDFSVLDAMKMETSTKSDANTGDFTIYVIPGQYDVLIEKLGYTQVVNTNKTINEGDTINLGLHILYEGDINRDGILDVTDLTTVKNVMLMDSTSPWYESQCDFLGKGYVDVVDLTATKNSLISLKTIEIR